MVVLLQKLLLLLLDIFSLDIHIIFRSIQVKIILLSLLHIRIILGIEILPEIIFCRRLLVILFFKVLLRHKVIRLTLLILLLLLARC